MSTIHSGSCLCKKLRFEIEGDFEGFYLCHCSYCQKDTGAAFAANIFSKQAKLKWLSSQEHLQTFNLAPTRHTKSFCKVCGSALPNLQQKGALLVVPAGSLDTPVAIKPNAHIFYASKASWEENLDGVVKVDKFPS